MNIYRKSDIPPHLQEWFVPAEIGLEETPELYVERLVEVFRAVRRVLRDDGTLWLVLGDSYNAYNGGAGPGSKLSKTQTEERPRLASGYGLQCKSLKPKDLIGIPWRVAFALQADGWYLRSEIIWAKPNPMPESVTDRPTKSHETIFLLAKSERYYFDADAVREPSIYPGDNRAARTDTRKQVDPMCQDNGSRARTGNPTGETRNIRSVWTVATQPFKGAHFATFPPKLIEPCIKAGSSEKGCCSACGAPMMRVVKRTAQRHNDREGQQQQRRCAGAMIGGTDKVTLGVTEGVERTTIGWRSSCDCGAETKPCTILDPFGGAGTTGLVADRLGRDAVLIDLNSEYAEMARDRIRGDAPLFAKVTE